MSGSTMHTLRRRASLRPNLRRGASGKPAGLRVGRGTRLAHSRTVGALEGAVAAAQQIHDELIGACMLDESITHRLAPEPRAWWT
jgi:hypothetical protein